MFEPAQPDHHVPPPSSMRSPLAILSPQPSAAEVKAASTLLREVAQERMRADTAERSLATTRHALTAKVTEVDALQREVRRLRERAEAAEIRASVTASEAMEHIQFQLHGANGAVSAQAASEEQRALMDDLHKRLRKSDERALKGEVLVAKLRAFIAQAQEERDRNEERDENSHVTDVVLAAEAEVKWPTA